MVTAGSCTDSPGLAWLPHSRAGKGGREEGETTACCTALLPATISPSSVQDDIPTHGTPVSSRPKMNAANGTIIVHKTSTDRLLTDFSPQIKTDKFKLLKLKMVSRVMTSHVLKQSSVHSVQPRTCLEFSILFVSDLPTRLPRHPNTFHHPWLK